MARKRRFSAEKKIEILREYLENQVSIADLSTKYDISPTQVYQWKKQLFEGALTTFTPQKKGEAAADRKVKQLEQTLRDRDSVISEIITENILLKKTENGRG